MWLIPAIRSLKWLVKAPHFSMCDSSHFKLPQCGIPSSSFHLRRELSADSFSFENSAQNFSSFFRQEILTQKYLSSEFQLLFQAEIFDSKFLSWNSELKFFESKFSAREMSWNSELKYFWVEIFCLEKELKFRAEILESKIMSQKFPLLPLRGHTLSTQAGLGGGGYQNACRLVHGGGGRVTVFRVHALKDQKKYSIPPNLSFKGHP